MPKMDLAGETKSNQQTVRGMIGMASELNQDGYTALHLACSLGHLEVVSSLLQMNPKLSFARDRYGRTPLHTACIEGRTKIIEELLRACSDCVMEVITQTRETALHCAANHERVESLQFLVDWLKRKTYCWDVINTKDCKGNTVLHLAALRRQSQIFEVLLASGSSNFMVDVKATNNDGFTAFDILCEVPFRTGAVRSKDIVKSKVNSSNHEACIEFRNQDHQTRNQIPSEAYYIVLLVATLLATASFLVALNSLRGEEGGYISSVEAPLPIENQSSYRSKLLLMLNSVTFFTSVALITIITQEFPLKHWLLMSVFSMIGAYLCKVIAVSSFGVLISVLLLGTLVLLSASLKCLAPGCYQDFAKD